MRTMNQSSTTPNSKKRLGLGLTVGLIGGSAAGLVFGVPGVSGAANGDTAPAALVQQTDEPDAPAEDATPGFEPGTMLARPSRNSSTAERSLPPRQMP